MRGTRTMPRSASTCTSAKTAPKECIEYWSRSGPGFDAPLVTIATPPLRAISAAIGSPTDSAVIDRPSGAPLLLRRTQPSATVICDGSLRYANDCWSATAISMIFLRIARPAACTAVDTLAADCEPPAPGAFGKRESPSSKRIRSTGMPIASAATCDITVYVPVPRSCVAERTTALPSGSMRTDASAGLRLAGYVACLLYTSDAADEEDS